MKNPVNFARYLGYFFFVVGLLNLIFSLLLLKSSDLFQAILIILSHLYVVVISFGLIKSKRWAIYGVGGWFLIKLFIFVTSTDVSKFSSLTTEQLSGNQALWSSFGNAITLVFIALFFLWLYSAREKFAK